MGNELQQSLQRLRYASVPTVTAPFGLTLGGGAEIAMHGAASRADAELYMGLVEAGVGLIPAGGGCKELLARHLEFYPDDADPFVMVKKVFMQIGLGKVSMSAEEARAMGMLSPTRRRVAQPRLPHPRRQADGARPGARRLPPAAPAHHPPARRVGLRDDPLDAADDARGASDLASTTSSSDPSWRYVLTRRHDRAAVRVTEQHILDLEREALPLARAARRRRRERMQYMLMNNKPLRN